MSYDVSAGGESFNYTSNMRQFFIDFGAYPGDWHGMPKEHVALAIDAALVKIATVDRAVLKAKYDAPNGWGDVESAIEFLTKVRDACRWEPPETVEVSR